MKIVVPIPCGEPSLGTPGRLRHRLSFASLLGGSSCGFVNSVREYPRMKNNLLLSVIAASAGLLAGCETYPPGAERGPHGTMAFHVQVEATPPGARIEVNGEVVGNTPLQLKIFGDKDGTFHDFGPEYYVIRALPLATNQFVQTQWFGTGHMFGPESRIPERVYFDMNQKMPASPPPVGPPVYMYPGYGPPPFYYGPSFYFGPRVRYYYGPRGYPYRRW